MLSTIFFAILSFTLTSALKFLAYNPQFANSHVKFIGKLTDSLADAGHDVVVLSTIFDTSVGGPGSHNKKARVIELPQSKAARDFQNYANSDEGIITWSTIDDVKLVEKFDRMRDALNMQCNETFHHPGLLQQLKNEKFDAAYSENVDLCGFALFHVLGIDKFAVTNSVSIMDWAYYITHVPTFLSYIPTVLAAGHYGEDMTFAQRVENVFRYSVIVYFDGAVNPKFQLAIEEIHPGVPPIENILANASLVFHNSEPLTDFPHLSSARNVDIGGITVSSIRNPLNKTWSDILDLRPFTVLISFGTFIKTHLMPDEYKRSIIKMITRFPDVTFIWKYEKPEHQISQGVPNLIESTWVPQKDMLYDGRLTTFVTHCSQGSTMEANSAGVPLIAIPVGVDQLRNAHMVKRAGLGMVLDKSLLSSPGPLEEVIREVINNPRYAEKAKRVARMLAQRPFTMQETFVRHMEFLALHGPLRQLDNYGAKLSFFQFYLLDVLAFFLILVVVVIALLAFITRALLKVLSPVR